MGRVATACGLRKRPERPCSPLPPSRTVLPAPPESGPVGVAPAAWGHAMRFPGFESDGLTVVRVVVLYLSIFGPLYRVRATTGPYLQLRCAVGGDARARYTPDTTHHTRTPPHSLDSTRHSGVPITLARAINATVPRRNKPYRNHMRSVVLGCAPCRAQSRVRSRRRSRASTVVPQLTVPPRAFSALCSSAAVFLRVAAPVLPSMRPRWAVRCGRHVRQPHLPLPVVVELDD